MAATINCPKLNAGHQCELINEYLGWPNGCPVSTCEKCLELGGPESKKAAAFRKETADRWVQVTINNIARRDEVHVQALKKHMTPEAYAKLMNSPEGRAAMSKRTSWNTVKPTWEQAESFIKSQISKGITSKRVELTVKNQRHISCFGKDLNGNQVSDPCSSLAVSNDGQHHFCNSCGCGDREVARLDREGYSKLDYPYLECPRRRPGFSNELQGVLFNAGGGGLGDVLAMFWIAEGYKRMGEHCAFYVGGDENKRKLLKMFNMNEIFSPEGTMPMGGAAPYYHYEVSHNKGKDNRLDVWASQLPGKPMPIQPTFEIPEAMRKVARDEIAKHGRPFVMLFPFANWNPRQWPISSWLDLAWTLNHHGIKTGTFAESSKGDDLRSFPFYYMGQDLMFVAAMMAEADLVIGNDSGPAWMASTIGVPTIALMGPTTNIFTKSPNTMELFQEQMACTGCHFDGARGFRAACDRACRSLMMLPHERVVEETLKCLENPMYIRTRPRSLPRSSPATTPVALSMSISSLSKHSSESSNPRGFWKRALGKGLEVLLLQRLWKRIRGAWSYASMQTRALSIRQRNEYLRSQATLALQPTSVATP